MWSGTHGITDYEAPAGLYMLRAVDVITVTSTVRVDVAVTIRVDVAVTVTVDVDGTSTATSTVTSAINNS